MPPRALAAWARVRRTARDGHAEHGGGASVEPEDAFEDAVEDADWLDDGWDGGGGPGDVVAGRAAVPTGRQTVAARATDLGAHRAAFEGDAAAAVALVRAMSPEQRVQLDPQGNSVLHVAALRGNAPLVRALLDAGVPVGTRSAGRWTALDEALVRGDADVVRALAERQAAEDKAARLALREQLKAVLRGADDYTFQIKWELGSPVLGLLLKRYAPHDTYTVWKVGSSVRIDGTLRGLDQTKASIIPEWRRGAFSIIWRDAPDEAGGGPGGRGVAEAGGGPSGGVTTEADCGRDMGCATLPANPRTPLQARLVGPSPDAGTPGRAPNRWTTPPAATPGAVTPPAATPGAVTPPTATPGAATPPAATPGAASQPTATPTAGTPSAATSPLATPHSKAVTWLVDWERNSYIDLTAEKKQRRRSAEEEVAFLMAQGAARAKLRAKDVKFAPARSWLGGDAGAERVAGWRARPYEAAVRLTAVDVRKGRLELLAGATWDDYLCAPMATDVAHETALDPLAMTGVPGHRRPAGGVEASTSGGDAAAGHRALTARCWMAEGFPLSADQLLAALDVAAGANKHLASAGRFARRICRDGLFPVKIQVPLLWTVHATVTVINFRPLQPDDDALADPRFFDLPAGCRLKAIDDIQAAHVATAAATPTRAAGGLLPRARAATLSSTVGDEYDALDF